MDAPWVISKNYDAWGPGTGVPKGDASRKRQRLQGMGYADYADYAGFGVAPRAFHALPPPGYNKGGGPARKKGAVAKDPDKQDAVRDTSSFVDAAMPLILLMQVGISMPVQRRRDGSLVSKVCSPIMVYALVVYALLSVPVFYAASASLRHLTDKKSSFHDQIYNMTPLLLLNAHPLLPFVHWPEARSAAAYFNSWIKFEGTFQRVCARPLHLQLRGWVVRQTTLSFLLAAFLAATMPLYMGLTWLQALAYLHLFLASICLVTIWLLSSGALCRAAEALRESMHEVVVSGTCTADLMADYRQAWLELSELAQESGRAWTYSCGHLLLYMFLLMTVTSFGVLAGVARHTLEARTMGYGAMAAGSALTLFVVCSAAETAADRVAQVLREDLLMVQLSDDTQHFKNEVQMFMTALAMDPPVVNLSGYATVNRALFASLLETMVTYLVVLVQFAYSLDTPVGNGTTTTALPTTPPATVAQTVTTTTTLP